MARPVREFTQFMNADSAPSSCQMSYQTNRLGLWVHP